MIKNIITPFIVNEFMLRALVAGIAVALCASLAGVFVIIRGMAFMGDALAHGVLPGVAGAFLLGVPSILGAFLGALCMVGGVAFITSKTKLGTDTAIGLLFSGMLALGVAIISLSPSFSGNLSTILFGSVLLLGWPDVFLQIILLIIIILLFILFHRPFILLCFSKEQAETSGFSAKLFHWLMLLIIALTVITAFKAVGTMLVFGMLLAPAAAASLLGKKFYSIIILSAFFAICSVYIGLLASYHLNIAAGAAITLSAIAIFFIVFLVKSVSLIKVTHAIGT